jgi:hypothetical protein
VADVTAVERLVVAQDARSSHIIQASTNRYRPAANPICHDDTRRHDHTSQLKRSVPVAFRNAMKPGMQCILVFRSYATAACQAARTAVICAGSG